MADTVSFVVAILIVMFIVYKWAAGPPSPSSQSYAAVHSAGSNLNRGAVRRRFPVSAEKVTLVAGMFPHIPREAIENDLSMTGNVEETCENILTGRIVIPATPSPAASSSSSSSSSSSARHTTIVSLATLPDSTTVSASEPPKEWESDAARRAENLRKRKEFMLQQARAKFMQKGPGPSDKKDD